MKVPGIPQLPRESYRRPLLGREAMKVRHSVRVPGRTSLTTASPTLGKRQR
jgi:hypothetical protein